MSALSNVVLLCTVKAIGAVPGAIAESAWICASPLWNSSASVVGCLLETSSELILPVARTVAAVRPATSH